MKNYLLTAASFMMSASILADNRYYVQLKEYAKALGTLFQITDDILDVTGEFETLGKSIGKDENSNKFTSIRYYTLDGARVRADLYAQECNAVLDAVDADTTFLRDLVSYVRNRSK